MIYAKLIDGEAVFAPRKLRHGRTLVYNPTAALLAACGYKPVHFAELPECGEGLVPVPVWSESEEAIEQLWTTEPEGELSDAAALEILLGGGPA